MTNIASVCTEHIPGLYHIRITHGDAAAPVPRWWWSSVLLREPKLPGHPSWSQPGCGGSSEANATKAQWLRSPAGSRLRTQYAELTEVSIVLQGRLLLCSLFGGAEKSNWCCVLSYTHHKIIILDFVLSTLLTTCLPPAL